MEKYNSSSTFKEICYKVEAMPSEQIWMNRDVLFAEGVQQQCKELGYVSLINNGELAVEELIEKVVSHFGLGE